MTVLDIKDITTEDGCIYYRKNYFGTALIELKDETVEVPVKFTIEISPIGERSISLSVEKNVDYPLQPVIVGIKKIITDKMHEGLLPC